jgi:3-phenylpropionate/trans-cinnamate dioxygenase ferredoxin subunit
MEWVKILPSGSDAREKLQENKPQLLIVHGKRICLVKRENQFFAVSDKCTHNGESLSKGMVNFAGEVVCPWHGHQFNLKTGREYQERSADLVTFSIREDDDGLYIGL